MKSVYIWNQTDGLIILNFLGLLYLT